MAAEGEAAQASNMLGSGSRLRLRLRLRHRSLWAAAEARYAKAHAGNGRGNGKSRAAMDRLQAACEWHDALARYFERSSTLSTTVAATGSTTTTTTTAAERVSEELPWQLEQQLRPLALHLRQMVARERERAEAVTLNV